MDETLKLLGACSVVLFSFLIVKELQKWFVVSRQMRYNATNVMEPKLFFMYVGQSVRIVRMDGCMAHVRGEVREGTVIGFNRENLYDGNVKGYNAKMALIHMKDTGEVVKRVAEPQLWFPYEDGVLEYSY